MMDAPLIALPPTAAPVPKPKRPAQKKSMAKQKDATGRCAVRPQRAIGDSSDKGDLTELYAKLYVRLPFDAASDVALARGFSDKELRVIMGMNKMLINDYNPVTGKYTEKTKSNKIKALLPALSTLAHPDDLVNVAKPKRASSASRAAASPVSSPVESPQDTGAATPEPELAAQPAQCETAGANFSLQFGDAFSHSLDNPSHLTSTMERSSLDELDSLDSIDSSFVGSDDAWLRVSASDSLPLAVPLPLPLLMTDVVPPGRLSVDFNDMDALENSMQRNSLDECVAETPPVRGSLDNLDEQDALAASMERSSLDDIGARPTLMPAVPAPSTQAADHQAAWQAHMNSRMLQTRQEHERQRQQRQAAQVPTVVEVSTPPEEGKRKRGTSLSTQLGVAFRRNTRNNEGVDKFVSRHSVEHEDEKKLPEEPIQHYTSAPHPVVFAVPEVSLPASSKESKSQSGDTSRYTMRYEQRSIALEVAPTGVTVIDGSSVEFFHLTTILSWRVRRAESGAPVGFKLVFTNGSDMIFGTEQGREISDVMMRHAEGLATLMQSGMPVRGAAVAN